MSKKKPHAPSGATAPAASGPETPDPLRQLLLRVAVVLFAAGFAVAVAAVLYRPERIVLVATDEVETAWLREATRRFADAHHAKLTIRAYRDAAELDSLLAADRAQRPPRVLLFEAPQEKLGPLVDASAVLPLGALPGIDDPQAFLGAFADAASFPASIGGRPYYVPSRLTTLCLCYSKARVADAVAHAAESRPAVESWLRAANGTGLPADFQLEDDPAHWDSYDVLAVAAYWASAPYVDGTAPRIAHVAAPPAALGFDLAARAYSMGAQPDGVASLDGFGVRDALAWESLFFAHGLYDSAMAPGAWDEDRVAQEIARGRIWLATLEPSRILRLHGLAGAPDSMGRRANPDIGLARLPRGVSLELKNRFPERTGDPWSARTGFYWAVPVKSPDRRLAADLVRAITAPEFSADASRALGWIPTRKDLLDDLGALYREREEYDLARQAAKQLYDFGRPLPPDTRWVSARAALARAWADACVRRHALQPLALADALRLAQPPPAAH